VPPPVALFDANVLYPSVLRDLLIRIAQTRLIRARWTDLILDEVFRNLVANRPDLSQVALERTRTLMVRAVPDCLVTGYESMIDTLRLPDPDDRHVLAAAIKAQARVIVTNNVKDFPSDVLGVLHLEAVQPDRFVLNIIERDRNAVRDCVRQIAESWRRPPGTIDDVLARLEREGLTAAATALRG
jgi:hypothetical protein